MFSLKKTFVNDTISAPYVSCLWYKEIKFLTHSFVESSISSGTLPASTKCGKARSITVSKSVFLIYSPFIHCNFFGSKTAMDERSEEHTSELQSRFDLVCRLLLEKKDNVRLLL